VILYLVVVALVATGVYAASTSSREVAFLLLAASGLVHTLFNKPQALCGRARWGGCEVVLASPYVRLFGIPIEWLGAAWFTGVLLLYYLGLGQMWGFWLC
jgi:uncharacterized membrane protein